MSLDITAATEWNGLTREAEAAHRFIELYHTKGKGPIDALSFHATLPPHLKEYVQYSIVSGPDYNDARRQIEGGFDENVRDL